MAEQVAVARTDRDCDDCCGREEQAARLQKTMSMTVSDMSGQCVSVSFDACPNVRELRERLEEVLGNAVLVTSSKGARLPEGLYLSSAYFSNPRSSAQCMMTRCRALRTMILSKAGEFIMPILHPHPGGPLVRVPFPNGSRGVEATPSTDGRRFIIAPCAGRMLATVCAATGRLVHQNSHCHYHIHQAICSPCSSKLLTLSDGSKRDFRRAHPHRRTVTVWDAGSLKELGSWKECLGTLALDGKHVITFKVIERPAKCEEGEDSMFCAFFHPCGRCISRVLTPCKIHFECWDATNFSKVCDKTVAFPASWIAAPGVIQVKEVELGSSSDISATIFVAVNLEPGTFEISLAQDQDLLVVCRHHWDDERPGPAETYIDIIRMTDGKTLHSYPIEGVNGTRPESMSISISGVDRCMAIGPFDERDEILFHQFPTKECDEPGPFQPMDITAARLFVQDVRMVILPYAALMDSCAATNRGETPAQEDTTTGGASSVMEPGPSPDAFANPPPIIGRGPSASEEPLSRTPSSLERETEREIALQNEPGRYPGWSLQGG
eukprot:TRINITY_DN15966_c0_g1_i1.p1 TRINITY_DN15966_c0_g1~~TRINITY_DN15966_c0_g1_i1.p1  ORF type:complete len:567 (-),score=66.63 TRINITY_DN15966_c0_g1_i1:402-2054(-)